jgi:prostaglandin-E synthase
VKEKNKYHWLKTDFNKWKDEDESEDEEGGQDLEEVAFFANIDSSLVFFGGFTQRNSRIRQRGYRKTCNSC